MTLITSLIFLKTHSHAKMAPDTGLSRANCSTRAATGFAHMLAAAAVSPTEG
jgi:hypothetical protein